MPPVPFDQIPATLRVPFVYVEIVAGGGAGVAQTFRTVLIGQRLAAGAVAENVPTLIGGAANGERDFGRGSMLAMMINAFRRNDPTGELWAIALNDAAGAVAQTYTVTATAAPTAAGTIALYIAGRLVSVSLGGGETLAQVATAIAAAVNRRTDLPVTAASAAAVVTLTARNAGPAHDLDVQLNFEPDEALPAGLALTIADGVAGAGAPDITTALDALGDEQYNLVVSAYTDTANINALNADLALRFGPTRQIDGQGILSYRGTLAQTTTYGNGLDSFHLSVLGHNGLPAPTWEFAAGVAGAAHESAAADPARPFQTLPIEGFLAPKAGTLWDLTERNTLLYDGISTFRTSGARTVVIERLITTYQTTDDYLNLNTLLTVSFLRQNFRGRILSKYGRHKLADDSTIAESGQPIITPSRGRAEAIAWAGDMGARGLIEDVEGFQAALIVERNQDDRDRLDFGLDPNLINQLRVAGVRLSFLQ